MRVTSPGYGTPLASVAATAALPTVAAQPELATATMGIDVRAAA
jgi:hypothetical protein